MYRTLKLLHIRWKVDYPLCAQNYSTSSYTMYVGGEKRTRFQLKNLKKSVQLVDLDVDRRIILNAILKQQSARVCEHSNKNSDSLKGGGIVDQLSNYQLLKKYSVPCSYFYIKLSIKMYNTNFSFWFL
jgi:hypothetical protein